MDFMVVATFKEGVQMNEIQALIPDEKLRANELQAIGTLGEIKISMPKRTTFIEAHAADELSAMESILSLPMSKLWNIEIFPTTPPAGVRSSSDHDIDAKVDGFGAMNLKSSIVKKA